MAIGTTVTAPSNRSHGDNAYDASIVSGWIQAITAGGMDDQDASGTVINPTADITASTRRIVAFNEGKYLIARMGYAAGDVDGTDPVVEFYGRTTVGGASGAWIRLEDSLGNTSFTLNGATATDVGDGTYQYTAPTPLIDRKGCNEVLAAVKTAYNPTGSPEVAFLEVKSL